MSTGEGQLGVELDRLLEAGLCRLRIAEASLGQGAVVMGLGVVRLGLEGCVQVGQRLVPGFLLDIGDASIEVGLARAGRPAVVGERGSATKLGGAG
ncbi:MAG: hypothetical protein R3B72_25850 [Polyangiaceae bacterium]